MRRRHHRQPSPNRAMPRVASAREPKRLIWRADVAAHTAANAGPGASARPAISVERCHTVVMNRTLASRNAANAAENSTEARFAAAKERTRNIAGSTTGATLVKQRAQNPARPAVASAKAEIVRALPHPHSGALTNPSERTPM